MDDPIGLATTAVAAVSGYLARVASGVVDRATDEASERLYQLVSARLQPSILGSNLVQRLHQQPDDDAHRQAVSLALADEVSKDPQFAVTLAELMQATPRDFNVPGQSNIVNTGTWNNRRGVIATGNANVDSSRRINISLGGFVLVIVAAILITSAATTGIVISIDNPATPENGPNSPGIGANSPAFPELEGNWYFQSEDPDSFNTTVTLHITGDKFRFDAANTLAQRSCSGTVSAEEGQAYYLSSSQGTCTRATLTLQSDNTLTLDFESGDTFPLQKE